MPQTADRPRSVTAAAIIMIRLVHGWSRERLADEMQLRGHNWDYDVVARIENDRRNIDHIELRDVAGIFGVQRDFLIDGPPAEGGGNLISRKTRTGDLLPYLRQRASHEAATALVAHVPHSWTNLARS